ncbi:hypothetical protein [Rhodococcus pyridinivorans]|uniref:hypothetical protein n=1 Tax=Rhodococcus pyridinivorans TaxID=103816 RepID=UPI003AAFA1A5
MTTITDRLAARIDDEFEYDYRVRDAVIDELTILCRTKKISAAKLKDSIIISCIESHMADLEDADDATPEVTHEGCTRYLPEEEGGAFCEVCDQAEDEGTMTDEIIAASLEGLRDALDADEPEVEIVPIDTPRTPEDEAVVVIDDAPKPKRRMTSHDGCDHPKTKAGRAACRRERAKAAAAQES